MTSNTSNAPASAIPWSNLKPYMSVIILECTAEDPALSFGTLVKILENPDFVRTGKTSQVAARSELSSRARESIRSLGSLESLSIDQLFGLVRREQKIPAWAAFDVPYFDITHHLIIALRRNRLIAIRADENSINTLQRKLDKSPRPPLRRIKSDVLEAAFMRGDAKSLWLRSVQRRSTFRPDSKTLGGSYLQGALDPNEDNSFAMGSARCEMPSEPGITLVKGSVGVTVRNSQVWLKDSSDFPTYAATIDELLRLTEAELSTPRDFSAFPYLAQEVFDLSDISGAYEVLPVHPDGIPQASHGGDSSFEAALLLQEAVLEVCEGAKGNKFKLDVGLDGTSSGRLSLSLNKVNGRFALDIGIDKSSSSPLAPALEVRDALLESDLLEVFFESGHKYSGGRVWKTNFTPFRFPRWTWKDFKYFTIAREKPSGKSSSQEIHDSIDRHGDNSLFAWVVNHWKEGWLICDDGSGEAADFFHLSNEDVLSIIHVKAASTAHPARRVRATDYEVVVSQASKNLLYMDRERLTDRLTRTTLTRPACWTHGVRVNDKRQEFLQMLAASKASGRTEIVIVQPHLSESRFDSVTKDEASGVINLDVLRLQLLEMLLKAARSSAVKYGADLRVIGSLT